MRMKRTLMAALASVMATAAYARSCPPCIADDSEQKLVIWLKDGTQVRHLLSDEPQTTFDNGALYLNTNRVSISYPIENVLRYTYEGDMDRPTAIDQLKPGEVRVYQKEDIVTFQGLKDGTPIDVYAIDGKLLGSYTAREDATTDILLTDLPAGTYIVKVKDQNIKFHKK